MGQDVDMAGQNTAVTGRKTVVLGEESQKALLSTGSVLGALAMSSCCVLSVALFSLGVTGAWLGNLAALYPYKWYFVVPAVMFIAGGFYKVYRKPEAIDCDAGTYCATPISDRINKIALWFASVLALAAIVFPYVFPYLVEV